MKLKDLTEASGSINIRDWMEKHVLRFDPEKLEIVNGKVNYHDSCVMRNVSRIEVQFGEVGGDFLVTHTSHNSIESLKNFPEYVNGTLYITKQPIKSLEGLSKKVVNFEIEGCDSLKSLDGAPPVNLMNSSSLTAKSAYLQRNGLTSLKGIHKFLPTARRIYLEGNPIKESILGLVLISELEEVYIGIQPYSTKLKDAIVIVRDYVYSSDTNRKGLMIKCQRELIEADLDEFAEM